MAAENMLFGDCYYSAHPEGSIGEKGEDYERELESLLLEHDPDIKLRIEKAAKDVKVKIQASLRRETALRLSDASGNAAIRVKVVSGLPTVVKRRLAGVPRPALPKVFVDKDSLLKAEIGLLYLTNTLDSLNKLVAEPPLTPEEVKKPLDHVRKLLGLFDAPWQDNADWVEFIIKINEDVLGAYFFNHGEIQLYWLVIGLFSHKYGISPESMTSVVAAHEWAHAYTHLGADAGGRRWDTEAFATSSMATIEGLAQYYGGLVCQRLSEECFSAYLTLLARQPDPYRFHLEWFRDNPTEGKAVPTEDVTRWGRISRPELREAVRFAMLEERTLERRHPQEFVHTLREVGERLKLDKK